MKANRQRCIGDQLGLNIASSESSRCGTKCHFLNVAWYSRQMAMYFRPSPLRHSRKTFRLKSREASNKKAGSTSAFGSGTTDIEYSFVESTNCLPSASLTPNNAAIPIPTTQISSSNHATTTGTSSDSSDPSVADHWTTSWCLAKRTCATF